MIVVKIAEPGDKLRNGGKLLKASPWAEGQPNQRIVLAEWGSEFATWNEFLQARPGSQPATENGHYFKTIEAAEADFAERSARLTRQMRTAI